MGKKSAGLLMYRFGERGIEVLLVHPGGPFYARKEHGIWSIPKGEYEAGEDPLAAARREFEEETGFAPEGSFKRLPEIRQRSGKVVAVWAFEGSCDPSQARSNTFSMEWPPGSGALQSFPEIDRAAWFTLAEAHRRILPAQAPLIDELERRLSESS